jgi:hypothetical protein
MKVMRKSKYSGLLILIALSLLTLNGCHLVRNVVSGRKGSSSGEGIVKKVLGAQPEWKFMEMRLSGKADQDDKKIGFIGTVKIEKDRQIYILLRSTIGIEVGRLYANRDSVWIISKMLNIKEKGDWKVAGAKIGYPADYFVFQGILVQSLFTSSGDELNNLLENLIVKSDKDNLRLVSNTDLNTDKIGNKYFNDFTINKDSYLVEGVKIRDTRGQWIADVKYLYNKENIIKKVEIKGIDSESSFAMEMNIVKKDIKDLIEINFVKF